MGDGYGSYKIWGAFVFCSTVWACGGDVTNSVVNVWAMKILEEGFKGWANVSNFVASVALKFHMFICRVHTMVAVPAELFVWKEAMVEGAWGASKCWERGFRRRTIKHSCRAFVTFDAVLGTCVSKTLLAMVR